MHMTAIFHGLVAQNTSISFSMWEIIQTDEWTPDCREGACAGDSRQAQRQVCRGMEQARKMRRKIKALGAMKSV